MVWKMQTGGKKGREEGREGQASVPGQRSNGLSRTPYWAHSTATMVKEWAWI